MEVGKNMDYKEIAEILCDGFMDMPSGCEGCPLFDEDNLDDDGNIVCVFLEKLRSEKE